MGPLETQTRCQKLSFRTTLPTGGGSVPFCSRNTARKHTWTVVHVTVDDLSSQTLAVAALPHWGGAVALSPPGADTPTT